MKQQLSEENVKALVSYRLSRAKETLAEVPYQRDMISRESNRSFSLLFERRHSSDYDDFAYATSEEVDELLPKAQAFISEIERLL